MSILITSAILAFCSLVQGAAGFAFNLFAVPLLIFTGYDFPDAVALTLLASLLQKVTMIYHLQRSIQWRGLLVPAFFMLLMLPIGVFALRILGSSGTGVVKRVVGVLILAVLMIRWFLKLEPHDQLHWGWGALAGGFSGFFQGLANVGGPPIVLWSQAHRWPLERLRIVPPVLIVLLSPFQIIMLHIAFGSEVWPDWKQMGIYAPVIISAAFAGVWLGGYLRVDRLRLLVTVLLLLLSLILLVNPLVFLKH